MSDDLVYLSPYQGRGHPHIVDIHSIDGPGELQNRSDLMAADGVATVLARYNKGVLNKFLDPGEPDIHFDRPDHGRHTLYIGRKGPIIQCGYYSGPNRTNWEIRLTYRIRDSGRWVPLNAIGSSCEKQIETDPEIIEDFGKSVATSMLMGRQWEEVPEARIFISSS